METTLEFDKYILTKEMNEKLRKVGDVYEVANISDKGFLLRDNESKVIVGLVSFDDFAKYFVKKDKFKGWTPWTVLVGAYGESDVFYRTNGKRVQVKFVRDKIRAEASCNTKFDDEFNLFFGIQIAYMRGCNKLFQKYKNFYERELTNINREISDNNRYIETMINSINIK